MARTMRRRNYTISFCICPNCGRSFPVPRFKRKNREKGHIKDIWCPFCQKVEKMREVRNDDFVLKRDFGTNNFD